MAVIKFPNGVQVTTFAAPAGGSGRASRLDEILLSGARPDAVKSPALLRHLREDGREHAIYVEPIFGRFDGRQTRRGGFRRQADATTTSDKWAGGVAFAPSGFAFDFVRAIWTVPPVTPLTSDGQVYFCSTCVGIDGDGSSTDLLQIGVFGEVTNSSGSIASQYLAWWQWYPGALVPLDNVPVKPGDVVDCYVSVGTPGGQVDYIVYILNKTTRVGTFFEVKPPSGTQLVGNCAEWIVERPTVSGQVSNLGNYGQVEFQNATAQVYDGVSVYKPVDANAGDILNMVDSSGKTITSASFTGADSVQCKYTGP